VNRYSSPPEHPLVVAAKLRKHNEAHPQRAGLSPIDTVHAIRREHSGEREGLRNTREALRLWNVARAAEGWLGGRKLGTES